MGEGWRLTDAPALCWPNIKPEGAGMGSSGWKKVILRKWIGIEKEALYWGFSVSHSIDFGQPVQLEQGHYDEAAIANARFVTCKMKITLDISPGEVSLSTERRKEEKNEEKCSIRYLYHYQRKLYPRDTSRCSQGARRDRMKVMQPAENMKTWESIHWKKKSPEN